jgi:hypothetical protein
VLVASVVATTALLLAVETVREFFAFGTVDASGLGIVLVASVVPLHLIDASKVLLDRPNPRAQ